MTEAALLAGRTDEATDAATDAARHAHLTEPTGFYGAFRRAMFKPIGEEIARRAQRAASREIDSRFQ